jgi:hypothetical protein
VTETARTVHRLRPKRHNVSEAGYAYVLRWNGERGQPTPADRLEIAITTLNSRHCTLSHPWSRPTKAGFPVFLFQLKTAANQVSETVWSFFKPEAMH